MTTELKTYLIAYDASKHQNAWTTIHQYIQDSKDFIGYWNYIPLVYAVKTFIPRDVLREKLLRILPGGGFILVEVVPGSFDGYLPKEAWDWFTFDHANQPRLGQVLQNALLSYNRPKE